jgi:hypothetical protein
MQSLGTGTQSGSSLGVGFSSRPDSYLRKPGIGKSRNLGDIYSTAQKGPFDDPVSRFESEGEEEDEDIEKLNIAVANIGGVRSASDSLSRIGTKAQTNQATVGGIGSYAGAVGPIGESILRNYIYEMIILENSIARVYGYNSLGMGNHAAAMNLGSRKGGPFVGNNFNAGGGIVRDRSNGQSRFGMQQHAGERTGNPAKWVNGISPIQQPSLEDENLGEITHVVDDNQREEEGIGRSTYELFTNSVENRDKNTIGLRRYREQRIKSKNK